MVDGIDANRRKWEELCSSYQQKRTLSIPDLSSDISPKLRQDLEKTGQPDVSNINSAEQPESMFNCKHDQTLESRPVDITLESAGNNVCVHLSPKGECGSKITC